ncbi:phospholipid/cholesterol/gamma-HCH transport system substrate-binding protein [Saccharomonospora amisosensis]|uniref:Phospholipid/cholesterol/gamma-HCH transport system substrate-binding protein n=1 Tax=Saccharomonospora amisosensis TaxID=1128677 RepID=A0A7X5UWE4_9PSEU|nr:MCE family protein [Saccharomonospora amisosensis]NIJ14894.1 phospholipid/cholesterol/gamma-HCH transport system substrate-binding protein [Saccharomonospora amisosensis]
MTLTGKNKLLLVAFAIISVLAVGYAGAQYAGLDRLVDSRGYLVRVELASSGGIFANAEVTYRGVTVGKVRQLHLTDDGVTLDLDIDEDSPQIPADTDAVVANRSAVGEQYVDLRPRTGSGPYLREGSVISQDRTQTPVMPEQLLANLYDLVSSVDSESLGTVVDETYDAFADVGPDLRRLLDSGSAFTATAQRNLPQTKSLLANGRVVLDTQRDNGGRIRSIAEGLNDIAAELKQADPDLRKVIDEAPLLAAEVDKFLADSGTSASVVLANLLTTTQIATVRTDSVEQMMVALPVVSAFSKSVSSNGEGHIGFVVNFFNPPSCTKGYEGTHRRPANETAEIPANTEAYCAEPPGSPISVRGSQNAPYGGKPVEVPQPDQESGNDRRADSRRSLPGLLEAAPGSSERVGLDTLLGTGG